MTEPLLKAEGLYKSYGKVSVLKDVNLSVAAGERHVIIGPNGAGKTTLFKLLSGELPADAGKIRFDGRDITALDGYLRVRKGFGRSFQVARIFPAMSVLANLIVALEARADTPRSFRLTGRPLPSVTDEAHQILDSLALGDKAEAPAVLLSHGDKKRLELAQILALKPRVLFLDEPTAGMSPADRQGAVRLIDEIVTAGGLTLVLTEHDMGVVFELGTKLTVLHYGKVVTSGEPEAVRANPMVRDIYLGQSAAHA